MIKSIIRHELLRVVRNAKTWYALALMQTMLAMIFSWLLNNFLTTQASSQAVHYGITEEVIHPFYAWFGLISLLITPLLCAQMLCAEKQSGTIVNYYCAPIKSFQVILGKFITLNIFLITSLAFISIMPLSILLSGVLDWGQYAAALFGIYLMLSSATAVCLSLSALMGSIIRANLFMFVLLAALILLEWAAQYTGQQAMFLQSFGLLKPLKGFLAGVISLHAIAYYLFLIISFLILSTWGYARRWQS